jgi:hypothetical protein
MRADTAAPLADAVVRLDIAGVQPSDTQWLRTGPDGGYRFDHLSSATYTLLASRSGFATRGYANDSVQGIQASWLHVDPGQSMQDVDIGLTACTPQSCRAAVSPAPLPDRHPWVISGTVRDQNGDPIDDTVGTVFVAEVRYMPQGQAVTSYSAWGTLDQQGNFKVEGVLDPRDSSKRIYLGVTFIGPQGRSYTSSYYPGVPTIDTAQRLEVAPGKNIDGLRMIAKAQATYAIHGKITRTGGITTRERYMVVVRALSGITPPFNGKGPQLGQPVVIDTDGSFTVHGVQAGEYILNVQEAMRNVFGETVLYQPVFGSSVGTAYLSVNEADKEVEIPIGEPVSVLGMAVMENQPGAYLQGNQIVLDAGPGVPLPPPALRPAPMIRDDATFVIPPLPVGRRFALSAQGKFDISRGLPAQRMAMYLKSFVCGGVDYARSGLAVSAGKPMPECTATLTRNTGEVTGIAQEGNNAARDTTVVLLPQLRVLRENRAYKLAAQTDVQGHFAISDVIPGDYFAFSVPKDNDSSYFGLHFADTYRANAVPLTVRPGETTTVNLKLFAPK